MTEEYELASFDRHSLNYDNVALGRLPTSVTTDPSVKPLREIGYLPKGVVEPHEIFLFSCRWRCTSFVVRMARSKAFQCYDN